jgi:hypothetical protein
MEREIGRSSLGSGAGFPPKWGETFELLGNPLTSASFFRDP